MLQIKENKVTYLFYIALLSFGLLKYYFHIDIAFFDLEEIYKTVFILDNHGFYIHLP